MPGARKATEAMPVVAWLERQLVCGVSDIEDSGGDDATDRFSAGVEESKCPVVGVRIPIWIRLLPRADQLLPECLFMLLINQVGGHNTDDVGRQPGRLQRIPSKVQHLVWVVHDNLRPVRLSPRHEEHPCDGLRAQRQHLQTSTLRLETA
eukprot:CAMPEP_0176307272 /NCGR_PEP_ID=MMETSP0121_2-20121125/63929_1 /TAXON_ID=160619 /ORGANISM="Kryptoperidinium foliaceum, Strain CCMP 1326" /LENGTH=149 /DNA_ID=CAMNT_0017649041 /DNA_START=261 /DNA_END=706 /DNA_ORIENTATION=-